MSYKNIFSPDYGYSWPRNQLVRSGSWCRAKIAITSDRPQT
jgi:hypothetical protein